MDAPYHVPVLRDEALGYLITDRSGTYVDATVGGGGHAAAMCAQLDAEATLICVDADADAVGWSEKHLAGALQRVRFVHRNFRHLQSELHSLGLDRVNGVLFDLGVSSFQLNEESRGFSYRGDERIDMRMDRRLQTSGWDVVNTYDERRLAGIFRTYGEERFARRIALRLVAARPIHSTRELREVIRDAVGDAHLTKTLSRVFQAIRIEVNDEIQSLREGLASVPDLLVPGGRVVVISYHSLEDRLVKEALRNFSRTREQPGDPFSAPRPIVPSMRILTKKPVIPREAEVKANPRARSAKLRAAERL